MEERHTNFGWISEFGSIQTECSGPSTSRFRSWKPNTNDDPAGLAIILVGPPPMMIIIIMIDNDDLQHTWCEYYMNHEWCINSVPALFITDIVCHIHLLGTSTAKKPCSALNPNIDLACRNFRRHHHRTTLRLIFALLCFTGAQAIAVSEDFYILYWMPLLFIPSVLTIHVASLGWDCKCRDLLHWGDSSRLACRQYIWFNEAYLRFGSIPGEQPQFIWW